MNWKDFLKPTKTKFISFFFLMFLALMLVVVMVIAGTNEKITPLLIPIIIMGWVMIAPFALITIAGLFLGNLLGGLGVLIVPIFMLLALFFETVYLYAISCLLVYLKNKIKK